MGMTTTSRFTFAMVQHAGCMSMTLLCNNSIRS